MVSAGMRKFSIATAVAAVAIGTAAPAATIFLPMGMISGNVPRGLIRTHDRIIEIYGLPDVVLIRDIRAHGIPSSRATAATPSDATMQADSGDDGRFFSSWASWAALIGGLALMGGTLRRQSGPPSVIA